MIHKNKLSFAINFYEAGYHFNLGWPRTHYLAEDLVILILLLPPLRHWDYRHERPYHHFLSKKDVY